VGTLISTGYIGQFLGALFFGSLAEKTGRVRSAAASIGIMAVMAIACVFSGRYELLLAFRFVQGFGIGGEVPVLPCISASFRPPKPAGAFFLLYEMIFPIGLMVTGSSAPGSFPLTVAEYVSRRGNPGNCDRGAGSAFAGVSKVADRPRPPR